MEREAVPLGLPKIVVLSAAAAICYIGAVVVLTEIADLSRASGLLLALVWLVPVFVVLWLTGIFDRTDSVRSATGAETRNDPCVDGDEPEPYAQHDAA